VSNQTPVVTNLFYSDEVVRLGLKTVPPEETNGAVVLFHRTSAENAALIISEGFKNSTGFYLTMARHTGVWLSNAPLDINEGARRYAVGSHAYNP